MTAEAQPADHGDAGAQVADRPVVLRAHDLRKRYGSLEAVRGVSFEIHEGETYGLLGPNGAGKTTTISMVCGLLTRDAGEVTLDGKQIDVGEVAAKAGIGYVPQDLAIYPDLSARENLEFFGRLYGLGGARLKSRVAEVLEVIAPDRTGERPGRQVQRRHAAAAQHRHRAAPPAAAAPPGRADRRRGPAEPERDPGERRGAGAVRDGDPVHDPLHGGGGAPVRPGRDHRSSARSGPRAPAGSWWRSSAQQDEVRLTVTGDLARASQAATAVEGVVSAAQRTA